METLRPEDITSVEELKHDDIASVEEPEPSLLEQIGQTGLDIGRGALSGLTFGGLEELTAAAKAGLSSEKEDFTTLYKKYLELEEQKEKEARERSPSAMFAGEVLGAIAPAFLTGGASLAASGGTAAAELGGRQLLSAAGKGLLAGAGTGAISGAVGGALGSTEGGLIGASEEEKQKLLEDIKGGALAGTVLGGALGGVIPLGKAAVSSLKQSGKKALQSTLLGEEVLTAKEMGEQGKGFITKASKKARDTEKSTAINDIKNTFLKLEDTAADEFKAPLKKATELGEIVQPKFDVDPEKGFALADFFEDQGESQIAKKLYSLAEDGLSPLESYNLRKEIKEAASRNPKLLSSAKGVVSKIDDAIEDVIQSDIVQTELSADNLPLSYKEGLATYSDILKATTESITEKGKPIDARRKFFRDLPASEATLFETINSLVSRLSLPGTTSEEAVRSMYSKEGGLVPLLNQLIKTERPEALTRIANKLGFNDAAQLRDAIVGKIEKTSKESVVKRVIQGEREIASGVPTLGGLSELLTRKPLVGAANIYGQATKAPKELGKAAVSRVPEKAIKAGKGVYYLPENALRGLGEQLKDSPKYGKYATNLLNALDSGDTVKKQAIVFSLMQDPEFRKMMQSEGEE